ncbi:hypothetical protein D3C85_1339250 [compost metagenome]
MNEQIITARPLDVLLEIALNKFRGNYGKFMCNIFDDLVEDGELSGEECHGLDQFLKEERDSKYTLDEYLTGLGVDNYDGHVDKHLKIKYYEDLLTELRNGDTK